MKDTEPTSCCNEATGSPMNLCGKQEPLLQRLERDRQCYVERLNNIETAIQIIRKLGVQDTELVANVLRQMIY